MLAKNIQPSAGEEPVYGRSVFQAILDGLSESCSAKAAYLCTEDGARLKDTTDDVLSWHPLCEIMAPGSPDPLVEPWLPFPFTARQLAAVMCDGRGYFISHGYGLWEDGPDPELTSKISPLGGKAQEALRAAYEAYRHALEMAPPLDGRLDDSAQGLAQQYRAARMAAMAREEVCEHRHPDAEHTARLALVNDAVANLGKAMHEARRAADTAHARWRRAVVQHLLLPIEDVPAAFRQRIDPSEESASQRQLRRLADLRAFGGDWIKREADWRAKDHRSGAFKRLVDQERSNGSHNFSEKSVRNDLRDAAEAEAEKKRSDVMLKGLAAP